MTDNEIIKALECCVKDDILEANNTACLECPMNDDNACTFNLRKQTLDIINRQKAEVERLKEENTELDKANVLLTLSLQNAQAEAIKEFAERLCEGRVSNDPVVIAVKCELK